MSTEKPFKKYFVSLCFVFFCFAIESHAFDIKVEQKLDSVTSNQVQIWLKTVINRLPPVMKSRFGDRVYTIGFSRLGSTRMAHVFKGSEQITLNENLLLLLQHPEMQKGLVSEWPSIARQLKQHQTNKGFDLPSHKDMGEFLSATLIHELAHQYDFLGVPPFEYLETRKQCIYAAAIGQRSYAEECRKVSQIQTSVSDLREFLVLAGFPETGFFSADSERTNFFTGRSPDPYENSSKLEAFAVNMEYYLLDPDYQCRRPALYNYLATHFNNYHPFGLVKCDNTQTVLVNAPSDVSLTRFERFDFKRLYQIHYFFAGEGDEMMSRFGHAMLRLVFCSPRRTSVGPECLQDLIYHRVVSYRAFIDDISINSLKGLTGDYPSSLYILPLASVLTQYNGIEFREIRSIPLALDSVQLRNLYDSILYFHWTYEGKYYFLSNNCATETFNLLKTVFYNQPKVFDKHVARPDSLYELLIKIGMAKSLKSTVTTKKEAVNKGYLYPSYREVYEEAIKHLIENQALSPITLNDYLRSSTKERRVWISGQINSLVADEQKVKNLAGFLLLEDLIESRLMLALNKEVLPKLYLKEKESTEAVRDTGLSYFKDLHDNMIKYSRPTSLFPEVLNNRPYGFPTRTEVETLVKNFDKEMAAAKIQDKSKLALKYLLAEASRDMRLNYNSIEENIKEIKRLIKNLKNKN